MSRVWAVDIGREQPAELDDGVEQVLRIQFLMVFATLCGLFLEPKNGTHTITATD